MKKVLGPIMKLFKQAKAHPLIAIPVALVVVLLIGGGAVLVAGGGDEAKQADTATTSTESVDKAEQEKAIAKAKKRKVKPAPVVSGPGTLDVARSVGTFALAQGRGRVKNPSTISVRVSAAPKQKVTVDYQLTCYKESGTRVSKGRYRPHYAPVGSPGSIPGEVLRGLLAWSHGATLRQRWGGLLRILRGTLRS